MHSVPHRSGAGRASLIAEVEEAVGSGSSEARLRMLRRVTDLFVGQGLGGFVKKPFRSTDLLTVMRRVLDAEMRKQVLIVDDCSTDGTRQILQNMAARQANNETSVEAQDGGEPIRLRDLRFFFQTQIGRAHV